MTRAFSIMLFAYVVTTVVAGAALWYGLPGTNMWQLLWADLLGTLVIFGFSIGFRNGSFYDAYWSVAPPFLALFWWFKGDTFHVRHALVLTLVMLWAARLTTNWARGWTGLDHEDWRYIMLREKTGIFYPFVNLLGIHVFPTLQVFAGCLPLAPSLLWGDASLNGLDIVGCIIGFGAVAINHIGDEQLRTFRRAGHPRETVLDTGLWAYSRHPNYLGEMGFWWALWAFALASGPGFVWTGVGALAISLMFRFISIPMIEERMLERRPAYARVIQNVPMVLPWPGQRAQQDPS